MLLQMDGNVREANMLKEWLSWHRGHLVAGDMTMFHRPKPPVKDNVACVDLSADDDEGGSGRKRQQLPPEEAMARMKAKAPYYPDPSTFEIVALEALHMQGGPECGLFTAMHADYISCGMPLVFSGTTMATWGRKEFLVRLLKREWPWPSTPTSQL